MNKKFENIDFAGLDRKRKIHIILPVFLVSVIAFIDRVNIAYAGMTMSQQLDWLTPEIFGAGAGMFFLGYFFFEIPGSLIAAKFDACKWIARIHVYMGCCLRLTGLYAITFTFLSVQVLARGM